VAATLGDRKISNFSEIVVDPEEIKDDIFLAAIPHNWTWQKVFFSKSFAQFLRERLGRCNFDRFYLDGKRSRGRDFSNGVEL